MYNITFLEICNNYTVVTDLMMSLDLVMEYNKSEIFHFSRIHNDFNPKLDIKVKDDELYLFLFHLYLFFIFELRIRC